MKSINEVIPYKHSLLMKVYDLEANPITVQTDVPAFVVDHVRVIVIRDYERRAVKVIPDPDNKLTLVQVVTPLSGQFTLIESYQISVPAGKVRKYFMSADDARELIIKIVSMHNTDSKPSKGKPLSQVSNKEQQTSNDDEVDRLFAMTGSVQSTLWS